MSEETPTALGGPNTPEGKKRVSQNARKHGIFVADSTLEQEDPQDFAEILAGYVLDYCPLGGIELELVRQLTTSTHRLRRLERIETGILYSEDVPDTHLDATVILAMQFRDREKLINSVERSRTRAERSFNRVYKDLEVRKAARITQRTPPEELEIAGNMKEEPIPAAVRAGNLQNKPVLAPQSSSGYPVRTVLRAVASRKPAPDGPEVFEEVS